ncbi:alpha/beta hydrolase [Crenobacter sp. SG2305]|uniref:alpha/beta hydrolase n=1 Tax=Crenobacter oryzisoli TaxID=3056844 RepID=UPI0025AAB884|nr:alpha/beta hydrolase [Crenobacter sp. SG2305]MDN0083085.1 alpha/beta hydrolase [Crenobacter sp. SG2305]
MQTFSLTATDGAAISVCLWAPASAPRATVLISHGMSEYAARYHRLATRLSGAGYLVVAHDHRGHGVTPAVRGHYADVDGWNKVVDDLRVVQEWVATQYPGLPQLLFGHSMGSFIARAFFIAHGERLSGLVLSATGYRQRWLAIVLGGVAAQQGRKHGFATPSRLLARLVFGSFNLGFLPARTGFDWLSRDPHEVDAYRFDPLCGFDVSAGLWRDLFGGIIALETAEASGAGFNRQCPVWLLAGSRDPVSLGRFGLNQLARRYRAAGLADVAVTVYPGGRHEMHNDTHRDEVERDLLVWLDHHLAAEATPQAA